MTDIHQQRDENTSLAAMTQVNHPVANTQLDIAKQTELHTHFQHPDSSQR